MSLRVRLTILYSALTGGILLLFGVLIYVLVSMLLINQVEDNLLQTFNDIIENTRVDSVGDLNVVTLPQLDLTANVYVQIWDANGRLHSSSAGISRLQQPLDPQGFQSRTPLYRDSYIQAAHLRVLTVPLVVGAERRSAGVIQLAANLNVVDAARTALLQIIAVIAIVSMTVAAVASWFTIGRALAPISAVTEMALNIARADDLSNRIPYQGTADDEIGQLITAFNDTLERLERLFTSQQRFLADVSHELRTPLTVVKGNVDLLRKMGCADEESLSSIEDEADRLSRLVGDLLLEAQAESGKLPLKFTDVELDTLLLDVYREMRILARDRVKLKVSQIDQVPVLGDPDRLKQVLINLVSNAIKYTPPGGEIILSLGKVGEQARLIVRDTGPGIPAEDMPHIFERFYRAEKSRTRSKAGGFGLGLSIAYWIITNHGGQIEVASQEGEGTTFCIWLPLLRSQRSESSIPSE
ncbi:MAG: HAMP domain-containing protein [Anaerolineales bacterium]|nr:HAMP domain-containing protein [Anaerolineales bacterium]